MFFLFKTNSCFCYS